MLQTSIAGLALQLQRTVQIDFGAQVSMFEGGKGFGVAGVRVFLLLLVLGKGVSFMLELSCTHETMLGSFEADESQLLLQLRCSDLL